MRRLLAVCLVTACATSADVDPDCAQDLHGVCIADERTDGGKADGETVRRPWGNGLVVVGLGSAVDAVVRDLDDLATYTIGKTVLEQVDARAAELGDRVIVRARPDPAGDFMTCANTWFVNRGVDLQRAQIVRYDLDASGAITIRERGEAVAPQNMRVFYNRECIANYDDGTACAPAHVYLLHEMQHVMHAMTGEIANHIPDSSDPMPGGSNHEEAWTIGRGAYLRHDLTENGLRRELGLPVRDSHGSLCGPRS